MISGMGRACSLLCLVAYKRQEKAISRVERETIMGDVYTCTLDILIAQLTNRGAHLGSMLFFRFIFHLILQAVRPEIRKDP